MSLHVLPLESPNRNFEIDLGMDQELDNYFNTRISGPDGPLILAVDLRNPS